MNFLSVSASDENKKMATELILVRHGHTIRVNGDYVHAPLTSTGQKQAAQTGEYLSSNQQSIDGFYASPLRRALETAEIIGARCNLTPTLQDGIREVEGMEVPALLLSETASLVDPVEDYLDDKAGKAIRWPIKGRVSEAILEIIAAHPNQRAVVVAHSGVISSILAWYFPEERGEWWLTTVKNCALTRLSVEGEHCQILGTDETAHLSPELVLDQPPDHAVELAKTILATLKRSPLGGRRP